VLVGGEILQRNVHGERGKPRERTEEASGPRREVVSSVCSVVLDREHATVTTADDGERSNLVPPPRPRRPTSRHADAVRVDGELVALDPAKPTQEQRADHRPEPADDDEERTFPTVAGEGKPDGVDEDHDARHGQEEGGTDLARRH